MAKKTKYARLNPQNKKRGNLIGNLSLMTPKGTFRFRNAKWYEVDEDLVPYLEAQYQDAEDPDAKPAFTIVNDKEAARAHVQREKELEEARKRKAFVRRSFGPAQASDEKVREVDLDDRGMETVPAEEEAGGDTSSADLAGDGDPEFEENLEVYTQEELEAMTVKELKVLAEDLGVEYESGVRKADLVTLISENSD